MEHVSYEKMPHSSADWRFAGCSNNPSRVKWCVTEKCHGANFCFHCDGNNVFYAKRTSRIAENDEFFGYLSLAEQLKPKILSVYQSFIQNKSMMKRYTKRKDDNANYEVQQISVYGELFGGFYPISSTKESKNDDSDYKNDSNSFVVQREILYSPSIGFYAFDIAVVLKNTKSEKTRRQYINYEDAIKIFEFFKLFYAKPIFIGKYEDCCHFDYEFVSNIPKWLGLPSLPKEYGRNLAEGIVIKPMRNVYIEGKGKRLKRPIVKHKHKSFNERIASLNSKYGQFDDRKKYPTSKKGMKGKDMINTECLLNMINDNRYRSVISKHGHPEWNKKSKKKKKKSNAMNIDVDNFYVKALVDDVCEDIKNDKGSELNNWWNECLVKDEKLRKYVHNKMLQKALQIVVRNKT